LLETPSQKLPVPADELQKAVAYTTIRLIGKRVHPLIAVNYFASWCAVVSLGSLLFIPSIGGIVWPTSAYQWALLAGIGVSGFIMQFCLTTGFQLEKVGRGTNMVRILLFFCKDGPGLTTKKTRCTRKCSSPCSGSDRFGALRRVG
jgi:hypothetical protein